jgi:excisionase family DNA binding protein
MIALGKVPEPSVQLMSMDAAANIVGCSVKTMRRWIAEGRLTGYRMGPRLIRVDLAEVEAMLRPIPTVQAN